MSVELQKQGSSHSLPTYSIDQSNDLNKMKITRKYVLTRTAIYYPLVQMISVPVDLSIVRPMSALEIAKLELFHLGNIGRMGVSPTRGL
jgi:hypothetical protein